MANDNQSVKETRYLTPAQAVAARKIANALQELHEADGIAVLDEQSMRLYFVNGAAGDGVEAVCDGTQTDDVYGEPQEVSDFGGYLHTNESVDFQINASEGTYVSFSEAENE